MDNGPDIFPIDYGELKCQIADVIRAVVQDEADKLGISYAACIDLLIGDKKSGGSD